MARQYVADAACALQGGVERVDCRARNAERHFDPFFFQHENRCVDCSHFCHLCLLP
jgi:hypothetical protein